MAQCSSAPTSTDILLKPFPPISRPGQTRCEREIGTRCVTRQNKTTKQQHSCIRHIGMQQKNAVISWHADTVSLCGNMYGHNLTHSLLLVLPLEPAIKTYRSTNLGALPRSPACCDTLQVCKGKEDCNGHHKTATEVPSVADKPQLYLLARCHRGDTAGVQAPAGHCNRYVYSRQRSIGGKAQGGSTQNTSSNTT